MRGADGIGILRPSNLSHCGNTFVSYTWEVLRARAFQQILSRRRNLWLPLQKVWNTVIVLQCLFAGCINAHWVVTARQLKELLTSRRGNHLLLHFNCADGCDRTRRRSSFFQNINAVFWRQSLHLGKHTDSYIALLGHRILPWRKTSEEPW